ncbi:Bug family tripartite tricarboxylate transporter substrate binding protein [Pigmentiphaga litoralis]|uniref:Bug family tripartite tricarboxylate transporter substrate binding protein n=1 Tax=Pigmentiphaga litoralis TaxID=516702 RepID=UPI003B436EE8
MQRRTFLKTTAAALAAPSLAASADGPGRYPSRPITLIVAYVAGGSTDQRARQLARFMASALGQPVIVENRPGANGNIGTDAVARAEPDGYTIGMGNLAPLAVNPALYRKTSFDPITQLSLIALIERGPLMLMVPAESSYRTVADLLEGGRRKPGGLSYGSSGTGSAHHLSGELLRSMTKTDLVHIPYKGGAAAVVALMGNQLDFVFEPMYSAMPSMKSGRLRALAITSEHRSPVAPGIPTMAEAGLPGFHIENWQGLIGPAGMPPATVQVLNATLNRALADRDIRAQMLAQGNEIGGGSPEQFAAFVKTESERWRAVIAANGIQPE